MPNSDLFVPKLSLAYAKIVATPTPTGWSQVYNAGSLFAALSLSCHPAQEVSLPATGKNLLNNLEAEFFTLEKKTLTSIKAAIEKSFENIPQGITVDACLAFFKEEYLYLFILGCGKIIMKRDEKIGTLLARQSDNPLLLTASGILQQADTIILQTDHFSKNIPDEIIATALELQLPSSIAENLSPHVHKKEDGNQAAIIITYNGTNKPASPAIALETEESPAEASSEAKMEASVKTEAPTKTKFHTHFPFSNPLKKLKIPMPRLTRRQKTSLTVGSIILLLLITSIIIAKQKQETSKYQELYQNIYQPAEKKYEEGKSLKKLNQNLAQDDFQKAEKLLVDNIDKFKQGSKEQTSLKTLLDQIKSELNNQTTTIKKTTATPTNLEDNNILSIEKSTHALAYSQDENSIYTITSKSISTINKKTGDKKEIITNDNDWTQPIAITPYQGNIYILDHKSGILKYVPSQDSFSKTQYFKGDAPNLESAQSMSIDSSTWILLGNGQILKYTRGEKENFSLSGANLASPTKIFTNPDTDYLYILDKGNSRILKISKTGAYQNQINADILSQATDFEILEKDQKANILSGDKTYSLPLQ